MDTYEKEKNPTDLWGGLGVDVYAWNPAFK
jgi:hypothetical protein